MDKTLLAAKDIDQIKGPDYALQKKDGSWHFADDENPQQDSEKPAPQLNEVKAMETIMSLTGLQVLSPVDQLSSGENNTVTVQASGPKGNWTYSLVKAGDQYFVSRNDRDVWFSISQLDFDRIAGLDKAQLTLSSAPAEEKQVQDAAEATETHDSP